MTIAECVRDAVWMTSKKDALTISGCMTDVIGRRYCRVKLPLWQHILQHHFNNIRFPTRTSLGTMSHVTKSQEGCYTTHRIEEEGNLHLLIRLTSADSNDRLFSS